MTQLYLGLAFLLLLTLMVGLVRALRGPSAEDRMLAAMLSSSTAVGIALVLSKAFGEAALRDVALVMALLAAIPPVVLARGGVERERA